LPHPAGVILVSLGTRYQSYCANVSRTYIINPNKAQEAQYGALLAAHEAACAALKEGQPARASMEAAVKVGHRWFFASCCVTWHVSRID
jgi:Xaa-Pro aminopeptidase